MGMGTYRRLETCVPSPPGPWLAWTAPPTPALHRPYHRGPSKYGSLALAGHVEPQAMLIPGPGQYPRPHRQTEVPRLEELMWK